MGHEIEKNNTDKSEYLSLSFFIAGQCCEMIEKTT